MHYAMLVTNAVQREGVVVVVGGGASFVSFGTQFVTNRNE